MGMPTTMTVSEARAALPHVIEQVLAGEEVTLTRHGQAVAVVVRPDRLRARRAEQVLAVAEQVGDMLERGRTASLSAVPELSEQRARRLLADVRAGRANR